MRQIRLMKKKMFSFFLPSDVRLSGPYLLSLAISLALATSIFSNQNRIFFNPKNSEISINSSDLNHSEFGYLPTSNPFSTVTKNQESSPDGDLRLNIPLSLKWAELAEKQPIGFDPNANFNSILGQIHFSHFHF